MALTLTHVVADGFVPLLLHLDEVHGIGAGTLRLAHAPDDNDEGKNYNEQFIRHVNGLLLLALAIPLLVPALPVLPGRVHAGVSGPPAPGPIGLTSNIVHTEFTGPAGAIEVISTTLRGVR